MEARKQRWTSQEFLEWVVHQPDRWELVAGVPVRMMGGARTGHNRAARNIIRVLGNQMLDGPCEPFGSDMAVETANDQTRYPDVVVACGQPPDETLKAVDVRMVVEVFSESTQPFDASDKLTEYRGMETLRYVLLVETRRRAVELHSRDEQQEWMVRRYEDDGTLKLPAIGAELTMAEIYQGMSPPPVLRGI